MIAKKLLTTIAFAFVLLFSGCAKDDFEEVDGVCPLVISTVPTSEAVGVPLNQIITATFNEVMKPSTITEASFLVSANGAQIAGTVSYTGSTATFTPDSPLLPNTEYTGTITTLASDPRGNFLQENYVWTFTTIKTFTVGVSSNPLIGGVTVGGGTFVEGTTVTLTATPNPLYTFDNWTEGGVIVPGAGASYQFVLTGNRTLVANYSLQFVVAVSSNPLIGGVTTGGGSFDGGTSVTVTATPNPLYTFENWTEGGVIVPGANATYQFVIAGNRTLVANYTLIPPTQFAVLVSSNPTLAGVTTGAGLYDEGTSVTVTATPNAGFTFANWTEGGVIVPGATATYQFVIVNDRTLVANYVPVQFTIALSSSPLIGGTTGGAGTFDTGTTRTVTATAAVGYDFANWTEGGVIVPGAGASYQFVLTGNRTLVANFVVEPPLQFAVIVSSNPTLGGVTTGAGLFDEGSSVTVTATPNTGFTFTNWTEGGVIVPGATATYQFVIANDRTLVANYVPVQFTIALSSSPLIGGTTGGAGTFDTGTTRTITATAAVGYDFANWTENGVIITGAGANYQFVLTKDRTLVANFIVEPPLQFTVMLIADPNNGGVVTGSGSFNAGSLVTVSANANAGYTFTYWTENGIVILGVGASYQFVLIKDRTLVANFTPVVQPPTNAGNLCPNPAVDLGMAGDYAILAKSGISTTGTTSVTGDMGASPIAASAITGFGLIMDSSGTFSTSSLVTGKVYASDYTSPTPANLTTSVSNMETAFTSANGLAPNSTEYLAGNLNNVTLTAGVYKFSTDLNLFNTITLDGGGVDCAAFVFQIAGDLIVANNVKIVLINGAKADNIFWVTAGAGAVIGTDVDFSGNVLSQTLISVNTRSSVKGRLLAQSAVTLNGNAIVKPSN